MKKIIEIDSEIWDQFVEVALTTKFRKNSRQIKNSVFNHMMRVFTVKNKEPELVKFINYDGTGYDCVYRNTEFHLSEKQFQFIIASEDMTVKDWAKMMEIVEKFN